MTLGDHGSEGIASTSPTPALTERLAAQRSFVSSRSVC
jgi:hypothetical protein